MSIDLFPAVKWTADRRLASSLLDEALGLTSAPPRQPPAVVAAAEMPAPWRGRGPKGGWTRESATRALLAFAQQFGRAPSSAECRTSRRYEIPSSTWICAEWGSREACYRALGLPLPLAPGGRDNAGKQGATS